jgi:RNA polymerase sigma factor (sigma-70 family)
MEASPVTRASLLVRLRDRQDHDAWRQFVDLYAALIYGFARRRGLQDADAADLMQDVLRAVARSADRLDYDPRRGTFRGWLFTVTRNKLINYVNGRKRRVNAAGDTDAHEILENATAPEDESLWEREYRQRLFDWAAGQVRGEFQPNTWKAFWSAAVEDRPPKDVAAELGLSVGAVYVAKSRVLARLQEVVRQAEDEGE